MNIKQQGYLISATAVLLLLGAEIGALSLKQAQPKMLDASDALYFSDCIEVTDDLCVPAPVLPPSVVIALTSSL